MIHQKLVVKIKGNRQAEDFLRKAIECERRNGVQGGTKYQINGSTYKVVVYGEFDDDTYRRILGGKKDFSTTL